MGKKIVRELGRAFLFALIYVAVYALFFLIPWFSQDSLGFARAGIIAILAKLVEEEAYRLIKQSYEEAFE